MARLIPSSVTVYQGCDDRVWRQHSAVYTVVRDLGVIVDADLSLAAHVSHVTSLCFFHLRQLRLIRRSLTMDTTHVMVRVLIHSRLDYCNALFAGLPAS